MPPPAPSARPPQHRRRRQQETQRRQRATAYGILNTCSTLAGGTAALVTALIMRRVGLGSVISSLAGLFLVLAVLVIVAGFRFLKQDAVVTDD